MQEAPIIATGIHSPAGGFGSRDLKGRFDKNLLFIFLHLLKTVIASRVGMVLPYYEEFFVLGS